MIDCLLAMVMKLSEVTFRPLFFKVTFFDGDDANRETETQSLYYVPNL